MSAIPKSTGYFDSFDGTEIYYEVRGKGEPLVFVYGIGCLINHWNPQIKYFSEHYKTIVLDYRSHNNSGVPENDKNYTLEALAKDIDGLLDFLNVESAHFVGHSFGAQVLCKTYDLFPHLFKSITFVNGFVSNPIAGMFGSDVPTKAFEVVRSGFELLPDAISTLWKASIKSPLSVPLSALAGGFNLSLTSYKDIEIYTKALSHIDLKYFLDLFEQMMDYDGSAVLSRIKCPALIIGGKKDAVTPVKHQMDMHERIENSQITIMPYGSHCTQLDLPEYVNIRIDKFISEITKVKKKNVRKKKVVKINSTESAS